MNWKKYGLAVVVTFVSMFLLGFLLHGVLLGATYKMAPAGMLRAEPRIPYIALGYLLFAMAACWVYAYGVENKPWLGQGVRYGLALAAMGAFMPNFVGFAVAPWPREIAIRATLADFVIMLVAGVCIAGIYRGSAGIPRSSGASA